MFGGMNPALTDWAKNYRPSGLVRDPQFGETHHAERPTQTQNPESGTPNEEL
jgi:hypothetical protein